MYYLSQLLVSSIYLFSLYFCTSRTSFEICVTLFLNPGGLEKYSGNTDDWSIIALKRWLPFCSWLFIFLGTAFLNDFIYTIVPQRCICLSKWYNRIEEYWELWAKKNLLLSCFSLTSGGRKKVCHVIMLLNDKAIKHSDFIFHLKRQTYS